MKENKIKIKLGIIGYLPFDLNRKKIRMLNSDIFKVIDEIENFYINSDSDTGNWEYSDNILNSELPMHEDDFFIGITYVPIEDNYYARRLKNNRIVISFFELHKTLTKNHIPLENFIFRALYTYSLIYLRNNNVIPTQKESTFTHDDTRGCLFDMTGNKYDILFSVNKPKICDECTTKLRHEKVSDNKISIIKDEIKKIKKKRIYKISDFIKKRPFLSICISLIAGVLVSLTANVIFDVSVKELINNKSKIIKHESDSLLMKK